MDPKRVSVYELFNQELRYVVPLFQRPYVWERELNWEPLWADIKSRAEAILEVKDGRHDGKPLRPHFLGAIVVDKPVSDFGQVAASEVIDGQQRLTTFQLYLTVLRDYAQTVYPHLEGAAQEGFSQVLNELKPITENSRRMKSPTERYKVWPTNTDREGFEAVMRSQSAQAVQEVIATAKSQGRKVPRMAHAYLYFYQAVQEWAEANKEGPPFCLTETVHRLEALLDALSKALHVVVIQLDANDDPQIIFESLNDKGVRLQASDLVKNFIFTRAARQAEEVDRLYGQFWEEYDDPAVPFWQQEFKLGRLKRKLLDLFLFHFLSYRTGKEINIATLFQAFKDNWTSPTAEAGLVDLKHFSEKYKLLIKPDPTTPIGRFAARLKILDITPVYPLLLFLLGEAKLEGEELEGMLGDLESFLVRRHLCRLTNKNYNNLFLQMLGKLREGGATRQNLQQVMLEYSSDSNRWPDDQLLAQHWLGDGVYGYFRSSVLEMILLALESKLHTSFRESIEIKSKLTLEHVLPQTWQEYWPLPPESGEELILRRERLKHSFGNLTLLTASLNAKQRNAPFAEKKPLITSNSALRLNTHFQQLDHWDEESILARGRELLELAKQVWPFPASTR